MVMATTPLTRDMAIRTLTAIQPTITATVIRPTAITATAIQPSKSLCGDRPGRLSRLPAIAQHARTVLKPAKLSASMAANLRGTLTRRDKAGALLIADDVGNTVWRVTSASQPMTSAGQ